jgi:hypothetical protein
MYTHLEDTPARTQYWNGSAWVSPFGSTLLAESVFTSAADVTISNVFTSAYQNYAIFINIPTPSTSTQLFAQMSLSGTPAASNYYYASVLSYSNSASIDSQRGHGTVSVMIGNILGTEDVWGTMEVFSPNQARDTTMRFATGGGSGANYTQVSGSCLHSQATAYDGIRFFASGATLTGTIRVYGMRNS